MQTCAEQTIQVSIYFLMARESQQRTSVFPIRRQLNRCGGASWMWMEDNVHFTNPFVHDGIF